MEFKPFNKIARLNRDIVITEKIDGTNAQIFIEEVPCGMPPDPEVIRIQYHTNSQLFLRAGSRSRWLSPGKEDNFGFAAWARDNDTDLFMLGPGQHFGEWWGSGIQRGYGLTAGEKRFSLFNVARWYDTHEVHHAAICAAGPAAMPAPACCYVVPVLSVGPFRNSEVELCIDFLRDTGSAAAPGYMNPEGVVVWHEAARQLFKVTVVGDEKPKGAKCART